jgi:hypothetical protein
LKEVEEEGQVIRREKFFAGTKPYGKAESGGEETRPP